MRILFLCSANICRSPLAETILRKKLADRGVTEVEVASAGIHDYAGEPRDATLAVLARQAGYELGGTAIHVTKDMIDVADLIICMEFFQVVELQKWYVPYAEWNRIHRFNDICFGEQTDVLDPSGYSSYIYTEILRHIEEGCERLARKVEKEVREGTKQRLPIKRS